MEKLLLIQEITALVERMLECLSKSLKIRNTQILRGRYGLDSNMTEKLTLDAIGKIHNNLTRERVRQIEKHSITTLLKEFSFSSSELNLLREVKHIVELLGSVVPESLLLDYFSNDKLERNYVSFFLLVHSNFVFLKEDEDHVACWSVDLGIASKISKALNDVYISLEDEVILPEERMLEVFSVFIEDDSITGNKENLLRWLTISKRLSKNQFNEWGLSESPLINPRNIRDYAYMVLDKINKPTHFTEVIAQIKEQLGKDADVATCHNALIFDGRFVLVGRGLYALQKWGYKKGNTLDVIEDFLKNSTGMKLDEVVRKVKEVRFVKDSTIFAAINNNLNLFTITPEGYIKLAKQKEVPT
jgi:hypothetical protein